MSSLCVVCKKETHWSCFCYYSYKHYSYSPGFWHTWCYKMIEKEHNSKIPPCVIEQ